MKIRETENQEKIAMMSVTQKERRDSIKENTRKQDEIVSEIIEKLQLLPLIQQERIQLVQFCTKELETEATRVAEYDQWSEVASDLLNSYKKANELQQNLIAGMNLIDREGYLHLSLFIDEQEHEDTFRRLEYEEAKRALHLYGTYATANEAIIGRKETSEELLERDIRVLELKLQSLENSGYNPDKNEQETLLQELRNKKDSLTEEVKLLTTRSEHNVDCFEPARGVLTMRSHTFHDILPDLKQQAMKRRIENSLNTKEFIANERRIQSAKDKQNSHLEIQQEILSLERQAQGT